VATPEPPEEPVLRVGGWVPAHRAVERGPTDGPLASVEHPEPEPPHPPPPEETEEPVPPRRPHLVGLLAAGTAVVVAIIALVRLTAPNSLDWSARWWPGPAAPSDRVATGEPSVPPGATPPGIVGHSGPASTPHPATPGPPAATTATLAADLSPSPSANPPPPPQVLSLEAESAQRAGGATSWAVTAASGGRIVGFIGNSGTVRFTVAVPAAGSYPVTVFYLAGERRDFVISVNGVAQKTLSCSSTGGWTTVGPADVTLVLAAGANTIQFGNPTRWAPDLDRIAVTVPSL